MSRYIDAITLLNDRPTPPDSLGAKGIEGFNCCLRMYNAQIEKQIANRDTDVVEVRHGEWEYAQLDEYKFYKVTCPYCNAYYMGNYDAYNEPDDFNYCPNCGAKMDGGRREE